MDRKVEILLNSYKNIDSVNVDTYEKIGLDNNVNRITEYDIRNVLSATEVFDAEREANPVYRIYGKMEYMSILNGLPNDYLHFPDFFNPEYGSSSKNLLNSFNFYLVKPAVSGYTSMPHSNPNLWQRYFQVIATPDQFELYPAGYSNNVYGEQSYAFSFSVDIDASSLQDNFGFPLTELFIYAEYIKVGATETFQGISFSAGGSQTKISIDATPLSIGDYVKLNTTYKTADIIEYSKSLFLQAQYTPQTFYIRTKYAPAGSTNRTKYLQWKYNPFIPLRLRYFSDSLYKANTGGTSYEQVSSIPYYATPIDNNGNVVWRKILKQGVTDPITGLGVDYPFVNKRRYLFSRIVFDITPDLNDTSTRNAFAEVWFERNQEPINSTPTGDLNDIGKPCL